MHAKLSQVLKAKLVANASVQTQELDEAVLACSEGVLYGKASTTDLALSGKLVVHSLE